jgi:enoyl-[acyl-carrier-protein] reductase (NADH)
MEDALQSLQSLKDEINKNLERINVVVEKIANMEKELEEIKKRQSWLNS